MVAVRIFSEKPYSNEIHHKIQSLPRLHAALPAADESEIPSPFQASGPSDTWKRSFRTPFENNYSRSWGTQKNGPPSPSDCKKSADWTGSALLLPPASFPAFHPPLFLTAAKAVHTKAAGKKY